MCHVSWVINGIIIVIIGITSERFRNGNREYFRIECHVISFSKDQYSILIFITSESFEGAIIRPHNQSHFII